MAHFEVDHQTLFAGHVRGIGARVREPFAAVGARERLLPAMDADVFLQVMLTDRTGVSTGHRVSVWDIP